jgi:COP9 signalosome complex subunit 4
VPSALSRSVLGDLAKKLKELPGAMVLDLGDYILDKLAPRVVSFEEEDCAIREQVAEVHAAKENYAAAAKVLERINLENAHRTVTPHEKTEKFVSIAEYWFEEDDHVNAERFINKAAHSIYDVTDVALNLRFKVCHTKILDSKRKFIFAASAYYDLSTAGDQGVDEDDLIALLGCSVTCAILAAAGPQKSRVLTMLFKDERTRRLDQFDIL